MSDSESKMEVKHEEDGEVKQEWDSDSQDFVNVSSDDSDTPINSNDLKKVKKGRKNLNPEKAASRRKKNTERIRKKRAYMSEERKQFLREKGMWRRRIQRGDKRVTPEVLKQLVEKFGPGIGKVKKMTPEQLEKQRISHRERTRKLRSKMPPEQREKCNAINREKNKMKKTEMTEEELQQKKIQKYLYYQAYCAKVGRYSDMPREYKDKKNEQYKEWKRNLTPEKKKRWMESVKKATRKWMLKKAGENAKVGKIYPSKKGFSEKLKKEQPDKWRAWREKHNGYQRKAYEKETDEERKRRRYKDKVNGVKRKLRKRLEDEGLNKEEIEGRLKSVHEQMWKEFDPEWTWEKYGRRKGPQKNRCLGETRKETPEIQDNEPVNGNDNHLSTYQSLDSLLVASQNHEEPSTSAKSNAEEPEWMENSPSPPPSPILPAMEDSVDDTNLTTIQTEFRYFPCSHCALEFSEESELRDHVRLSHAHKMWTCPKCKETVLSPQELKTHFQEFHKVPTSSPQDKSTSNQYNFFCMRCPVTNRSPVGFQTRLELFSHVKLKHKWKCFWPCDKCNVLKYSKEALEIHKRVH